MKVLIEHVNISKSRLHEQWLKSEVTLM